MSKRTREDAALDSSIPAPKRIRDVQDSPVDRLSSLSNELLLNILSFLPIESLNVCQRFAESLQYFLSSGLANLKLYRLSRRFHALGGDSELWKRQYYSHWVRPRARRLTNVRRSVHSEGSGYSPKVSTWLDHGHLAKEGKVTNWKRQYRLRHNWSKGLCRVTEVELPPSSRPLVLVKLCSGVVFTADAVHGLRAWAAKDPTHCIASISFGEATAQPTALAVSELDGEREIVVGFEDGRFCRFGLDIRQGSLIQQSVHVAFSDGAITAMALSSPYLLVVSQWKTLSLHRLEPLVGGCDGHSNIPEPHELASLRADNMVAPMTLSLRVSALEIVVTIVYSFFHIGCGWSLGIQELRFDKQGQQLESRLASTVDSQYGIRPLQNNSSSGARRHSAVMESHLATPTAPSILHQQPPTSMSYSHPYLLTSHADNTLTMYLVVSNSNSLFVRGGQRLWGHTSSVSAVQVTNRGKAVSVSSHGDEVRIWELETTISSLDSHRPLKGESSIEVSPDNRGRSGARANDYPGARAAKVELGISPDASPKISQIHECVGFDDERVYLLREKDIGTQSLECYDFT